VTELDRIEPVWLDAEVAFAIHERQLAEHGGGIGVRASDMLGSALGRPVNQWHYGEDDRCALAAANACSVARNIRLSMVTNAQHGCWRACFWR
jgi:death on curing protein